MAAMRGVVAFEDRTGAFVFVPVAHGLYLRTHRCVVEVACPDCGAEVNQTCKGAREDGLPRTDTHWKRRDVATKLRKEGKLPAHKADDLLHAHDTAVATVKRQLAKCQRHLALAEQIRDGAQDSATKAVEARRAIAIERDMFQTECERLRAELAKIRGG